MAYGDFYVMKNEVRNLSALRSFLFDRRYVCDEDGVVYLIKSNFKQKYLVRKLKPYKNRDGYWEYVLTEATGRKRHVMVYRVVAELFVRCPNYRTHTQVNHIDHNKDNNSASNLEWVTPAQNIQKMYAFYKDKRAKEKSEVIKIKPKVKLK